MEFDRGDLEEYRMQIVLLIDGIQVDSCLQSPQDDDDPRTRFKYVEIRSAVKEFQFSNITLDIVGELLISYSLFQSLNLSFPYTR